MNKVSGLLHDFFESKGMLIEQDAINKYEQGEIERPVLDELLQRYEGTKYDVERAA